MTTKHKNKELARPKSTTTTPPIASGNKISSDSNVGEFVVDGSVIEEREGAVRILLVLTKQSDKYRDLMGAVHVLEGATLEYLRDTYSDTDQGRSEYERFLELKGVGIRMGDRYRQLFKLLKDGYGKKRKLDLETQILIEKSIEKSDEFPLDIVEVIADKVGRGKTMTDLMRDVGILPSLGGEGGNKATSAVDKQITSLLTQIENRTKQVTTLVDTFETVKTDPGLLAIVHKSGTDWIAKLDALMLKLRGNLDRIQIASIVERSDPEMSREGIRQRKTEHEAEATDPALV